MLKSYLITDPEFYSSKPHTFAKKLEEILQKQSVSQVLVRDKTNPNLKALAQEAQKITQKFGVKLLISQNISLAVELSLDGVHLTSKQFESIAFAKQKLPLVGISTHTLEEAKLAQSLGADFITYSPIFDTPNKGKAKGLGNLNQILDTINIQCFALGGITTQSHIDAISLTKAVGFASIRYFVQ